MKNLTPFKTSTVYLLCVLVVLGVFLRHLFSGGKPSWHISEASDKITYIPVPEFLSCIRRLYDGRSPPPIKQPVAGGTSDRRLGIVTVMGSPAHLQRDGDSVGRTSGWAAENHVPYFVETHVFRRDFFNKQHAVLKYLPHYEWILYMDTDTILVDLNRTREMLFSVIDRAEAGGHHVVISEVHHSSESVGGPDAGIFMVKRSAIGFEFLHKWLQSAECYPRNGDNGALWVLFLGWVLDKDYAGQCDQYVQRLKWYETWYKSIPGFVRDNFYHIPDPYYSLTPCMYQAFGQETAPFDRVRLLPLRTSDMRAASLQAEKSKYHPFYVFAWDELGALSSQHSKFNPIIGHGRDILEELYST